MNNKNKMLNIKYKNDIKRILYRQIVVDHNNLKEWVLKLFLWKNSKSQVKDNTDNAAEAQLSQNELNINYHPQYLKA